jgi:N-acyl-D-amino-acid deacylase
MPSLLLRGGSIVDGTGGPAFRGDIRVAGGRVVAVGKADATESEEILDVDGRVVAPGFIDLHSHGDLIWAWPSPRREEIVRGRIAQGITTEIVGNCGLGVAPLLGDAAHSILADLNGWMSPQRFSWEWKTLDGYLTFIEKAGLPVNVGTLVAHGPLRIGAMGLVSGDPDQGAVRVMLDALAEALDAGAFGLSAGLIYPPGMYSSTLELIELARPVERRGGVFTCHVRGSSETLLPAVDELLRIGWEAGVAVHHSHAEAVGRAHWTKIETFLEREDDARRKGLRASFDVFPYPVAATMMLAIYPPWSLAGGPGALLKRLVDPEARRRMAKDIESVAPEWPPWIEGRWPHNLVRTVGWEGIRIASVGSEKNRPLEGISLAELGSRVSKSPFDAISDLMIEEQANVGQFVEDISGEAGLRRLIAHPAGAFITDANDYGKGKPHPAAYGSLPRILGRYVREERALGLEEAVRRMTSLPADILGIRNRGRIREGAWADLVVFHPESVADRATLAEPRSFPEGVEAVIVNGELAWRGVLTSARAGRVIRKGEA